MQILFPICVKLATLLSTKSAVHHFREAAHSKDNKCTKKNFSALYAIQTKDNSYNLITFRFQCQKSMQILFAICMKLATVLSTKKTTLHHFREAKITDLLKKYFSAFYAIQTEDNCDNLITFLF